MADKFLNRDDSPFKNEFWNRIDHTVKIVAINHLSARKLLYTEGPLGLGLQFIPGTEQTIEGENQLTYTVAQHIPLIMLNTGFAISSREIEAFSESGVEISPKNLIVETINICHKEDNIVFNGIKKKNLPGLLNYPGVERLKLKPWDQIGDAVEAVLGGIEKLDKAGFHGPYSLALSVQLYNKLFRRYPQGNTLELDHMKQLVTDGVIKAATISSGGVLLASGKEYASIILGQDLVCGFEGPSGKDFIFTLSESIALRMIEPASVCVLES